MENILEEEKTFQISTLCHRRSQNQEEFMNCVTLFNFFLENITQEEFIKAVQQAKQPSS
jgi:hypothetical protein